MKRSRRLVLLPSFLLGVALLAFVGNVSSRGLVRDAIGSFRETAAFPSEGAALPGWIPGVGWSDPWSFWEHGYPAIMVTDTAPFRYRHDHSPSDIPDKIDYERLARVVEGLRSVVARMSRTSPAPPRFRARDPGSRGCRLGARRIGWRGDAWPRRPAGR